LSIGAAPGDVTRGMLGRARKERPVGLVALGGLMAPCGDAAERGGEGETAPEGGWVDTASTR
jgi:hypothetical protein